MSGQLMTVESITSVQRMLSVEMFIIRFLGRP